MLNHIQKPSASRRTILTGAIAVALAPPVASRADDAASDSFLALVDRYWTAWHNCHGDSLGRADEQAWIDLQYELEDELCEVLPTSRAGAVEAIRFAASHLGGPREPIDCLKPLLDAAVAILSR